MQDFFFFACGFKRKRSCHATPYTCFSAALCTRDFFFFFWMYSVFFKDNVGIIRDHFTPTTTRPQQMCTCSSSGIMVDIKHPTHWIENVLLNGPYRIIILQLTILHESFSFYNIEKLYPVNLADDLHAFACVGLAALAPSAFRISFNILLFVFKAPNGLASHYLRASALSHPR